MYEDIWSGSGRSRTSYTNYRPSSNEWFNATTKLNITPSGTWNSANNGYHYLNIVVRDNNDNTTQNGWVSFRSVPYSISIGSVQSQNSVSQTSNATVPVTVTKATSGVPTPANLSRAFEWTYPTQTEYGFAVGNCTSAVNGTACQVSGAQNVTLIPPSGGWPSGYHYIYLEFVSPSGANKVQADNSAWFNAVQAYDGYFSNWDEGGQWKYYFGFNENITILIYVRNSNYIPQNVNITKVEMSEDGDNCWSEYCRVYSNYSYQVLNGSGGTGIAGNGTIRIVKPAAQWKRGQHSIKATIQGSAGNAVIKTGYVYVKDTALPNVTIVSPQNGQVINTSTFLFNATTNEDARCGAILTNYDQFLSSFCGGGSNITTGQACNSTRFNGSTYYYLFVDYPPFGGMSTGGRVHHYSFNTAGLVNQDYGIKANCYDVDWNYAATLVAFTLNVSTTNVQVKVNLSSPANNSVVNTSTVTFDYNATGPSYSNLNCTVYINVSSTLAANTSRNVALINSTNITTAINVTGFNNGTYIWNTYCSETTNATNNAWAPSNFTFSVAINSTSNSSNTTLTAVGVNLSSPANNAVMNSSPVNFTYNASGPASMSCSLWSNSTGVWKANSTNTSATPGVQNVTHNFVNGAYVWNSRCEDNSNSSNYAFAALNFTLTVTNLTGTSTTSTNISVNLSSPANVSTISAAASFVYNATGAASLDCTVWGNFTGSWAANVTNNSVSAGVIRHAQTVNVSGGVYLWNAQCINATDSTIYGWGISNWTFTRS
ncbi:hypothetical protein HYV83_03065 [Candidatus Woesearchaeota archaeon]|nr:hypothetical protein [Candidatus Woesearchaeota archaeon]